MTELLYMKDSQRTVANARCTASGHDERGAFLEFDLTIFHPQGGGQASDTGTVSFTGSAPLHIAHVQWPKTGGAIPRHYVAVEDDSRIEQFRGQEVTMAIDPDRRKVNARLHSGGHLIAALVEGMVPGLTAVRGHHFPNEACVEFSGAAVGPEVTEILQNSLPAKMAEYIHKGAPVMTSVDQNPSPGEKPRRTVSIGEFPAVGCGGTHVENIGALGSVIIKSIKAKSERLRISYSCA